MTRKRKSKSVPSTINGRLRPQRDRQRSDSAPESGWTSMAMISPTKVNKPSQVFFCASGTKLSRTAGRMMGCRAFHMNESPTQ